ncbi:sensor histidine kinase [Streptomyces sp. GS7]|uniref:sensor histidine kinase n=1 Tax=Streptomyces sp. GS7 TaxID=2692234 RepID=UPI001F3DC101|nr:HAMP domain-containing sensor histidine kinase [Streptomyces sp. GS7]
MRTSLAAAAASAVLLGGGAAWVHHTVFDQAMAATRERAAVEAAHLESILSGGSTPWGVKEWMALPYSENLPYEIVAGKDTYVASSPELQPFDHGGPTLPAPDRGGIQFNLPGRNGPLPPDDIQITPQDGAHLGTPAGSRGNPLAGRTFPVVAIGMAAKDVHPRQGVKLLRKLGDGENVAIYVLVTPFEAQAATDAIDRILLPAVPLGVLLVAAVAYLATARALRPVEAIRARTAAVTATNPRERVDIPDTADEISALATTINATLERLDAAATAQRRFVADAAHELRSPLTTLLAGLEIALAYPDKTEWPTVGTRAASQARRLQTLANDLLLLARLDATSPSAPTDIDLADLVSSLANDYAAQTRGHPQVHCTTKGPAAVLAAPGALERILRNLLDNATRYAHHRVDLTIHTEPAAEGSGSAGAVVVEVRDDGPGIPAHQRERIFERFTRLDDARDRDSGGAGLGLAIARELAERHHAVLQAATSATGAHFILRWPKANPSNSNQLLY